MITHTHKYELALKSTWTYKDIMEWCEVSKATAIKIKNRAIKEANGGVKFGSQMAKVDSVLSLFGTTREREIEILRRLLNGSQEVREGSLQN